MRTNHRSGDEVADDWRQADALREIAEHERSREAAREREDEIEIVHRAMVLRGSGLSLPGDPAVPPGSEQWSEDGRHDH